MSSLQLDLYLFNRSIHTNVSLLKLLLVAVFFFPFYYFLLKEILKLNKTTTTKGVLLIIVKTKSVIFRKTQISHKQWFNAKRMNERTIGSAWPARSQLKENY